MGEDTVRRSTQTKRFLLAALIAGTTGCSSTGSIAGVNPFLARSAPADGVSAQLSDEDSVADGQSGWLSPIQKVADGARGQVGSMSLVVQSAYGKAKSAVSGAFTSEEGAETGQTDALSLANVPTDLGPEVYVANGQLWETNGDFNKALEQYGRALELEPENAAALASVARLHDRQGNVDQAIKYFHKAIESEPSDPGLYSDLGMLLSKMGRHDEAAAQLQKSIAIAPKTKRYANNLAIVLMEAGRSEEAFSVLAKAHEPAKAHYNMAYLEYQHQNLEKTRGHLQQAIALDPTLKPAHDLLTRVGDSQVAQTAQKVYDTASAIATHPGVRDAIAGAPGVNTSAYAATPAAASEPATAGAPETGNPDASGQLPAGTMRVAARPTVGAGTPSTPTAPQTPPPPAASAATPADTASAPNAAGSSSGGETVRLTDSKPADSAAMSSSSGSSAADENAPATPAVPPGLQLPPSLMSDD